MAAARCICMWILILLSQYLVQISPTFTLWSVLQKDRTQRTCAGSGQQWTEPSSCPYRESEKRWATARLTRFYTGVSQQHTNRNYYSYSTVTAPWKTDRRWLPQQCSREGDMEGTPSLPCSVFKYSELVQVTCSGNAGLCGRSQVYLYHPLSRKPAVPCTNVNICCN